MRAKPDYQKKDSEVLASIVFNVWTIKKEKKALKLKSHEDTDLYK